MGWFSCDPTTCAECCHLDPTNLDRDGYLCEKGYKRVSPNAQSCNDFTKAYNRSDSEIKSLRETPSSGGSGCFITTIVVDTLGYKDNVSYLQTLRYFRDEVLQKADQYREILATYDVVGPEISKSIQEDKNRKQISLNLFNLGVSKVCKLIEEKKEKEAVELYMDMTKLLISGYGINDKVSEEYLNNMDVEKSGHGRKVLK